MAIQIPLVVVLWEHTHAQGVRRIVVWDERDLREHDFNDCASSIGVHPGPDYEQWKAEHGGAEPTASLYQDMDYGGAVLTLTTGYYPDIHARFAFGDCVSSVRVPGEREGAAESTEGAAALISPIPVVMEVFTDSNFSGFRAVIVEDVPDLGRYLGGRFNDSISSVRVTETRDGSGAVGQLCEHAHGEGRRVRMVPGNYSRLGRSDFNDRASSAYVVELREGGDQIERDPD